MTRADHDKALGMARAARDTIATLAEVGQPPERRGPLLAEMHQLCELLETAPRVDLHACRNMAQWILAYCERATTIDDRALLPRVRELCDELRGNGSGHG